MAEASDQQALYEMARKIASQKAGSRYYREDVIADADLAVADGATGQRDIESAVRRSLRSEWGQEDGKLRSCHVGGKAITGTSKGSDGELGATHRGKPAFRY